MSSNKDGIFPAVKRIVAIGDLHGDYQQTIRSLQLAKVIKLHGSRWVWCGGTTYVVQLGDQLDRKARDEAAGDEDSEFKIMKLMDYLDCQAQKDGGRVLSLAGNHEQLQTKAHFHYVSPKGFAHFGGADKRELAFRPGGEMALYMAKHRYAVIKIGSFIFVHGGVVPKIAEKWEIPTINQMLRDYLTGKLKWNKDLYELFESNDSILWNRSQAGPRPVCEKLDYVLKKWNGKALILGHTPQEDGITSACDNKVWRVDVGLSAAIMGAKGKEERVQVLEIVTSPNKQAKLSILTFKEDAPKPKSQTKAQPTSQPKPQPQSLPRSLSKPNSSPRASPSITRPPIRPSIKATTVVGTAPVGKSHGGRPRKC